MSLVFKGVEPKKIDLEDGLHVGKLSKLEERKVDGKDYSYLDLFILLQGEEVELKVGYPLPKAGEGINEKTQLGKLVKRFTGKEIVIDSDYNLEDVLKVDSIVQFMTLENQKGYAEVIKDSLKLSPMQHSKKGASP